MMIRRAAIIWIVGLLTVVPYATYYLFFEATKDQYAALIVFVLFWIFGYWGVVGPLLSALKIRAAFRAIERSREPGQLRELIQSEKSQDAVIDLIASENGIPKFLATRVYRLMLKRISSRAGSPDNSVGPERPERVRK